MSRDTSTFPPALQLASPVPEFMSRYDFSGVPAIPPSTPRAAKRAVDCTALNANTCSWGCGACTRDHDLIGCKGQNDWALTFDDGPSEYTGTVLNWLRSNGKKATFFLIGSQVNLFQDVARQIVAEGHQIGIHTWSHPALTSITTEEVVAELEWTKMAITQATGVSPVYFRPPYGDIDDRVRAIVAAMGLSTVIWNFDSQDYKLNSNPTAIPPGEVEGRVKAMAARPIGVISLEHDISSAATNRAISIGNVVLNSSRNIVSIDQCGQVSPRISGPPKQQNPPSSPTVNSQSGAVMAHWTTWQWMVLLSIVSFFV